MLATEHHARQRHRQHAPPALDLCVSSLDNSRPSAKWSAWLPTQAPFAPSSRTHGSFRCLRRAQAAECPASGDPLQPSRPRRPTTCSTTTRRSFPRASKRRATTRFKTRTPQRRAAPPLATSTQRSCVSSNPSPGQPGAPCRPTSSSGGRKGVNDPRCGR